MRDIDVMPEAAMHEDRYARVLQGNIRAAKQAPVIRAVAPAKRMHQRSHSLLWFSEYPLYGTHDFRSPFRRPCGEHQTHKPPPLLNGWPQHVIYVVEQDVVRAYALSWSL